MKKNNICFSVIFRVAGSICILIAAALLYVYMFLVESPSLSMIFLLIAILASGILLLILGRLKDNKEKNIYKKNKLITSPKNKKLCMSAKFKIAGYTCVFFSIIFYFVCLFLNWNTIPFISVFAIAIIVFGILFLILGYNWKKNKDEHITNEKNELKVKKTDSEKYKEIGFILLFVGAPLLVIQAFLPEFFDGLCLTISIELIIISIIFFIMSYFEQGREQRRENNKQKKRELSVEYVIVYITLWGLIISLILIPINIYISSYDYSYDSPSYVQLLFGNIRIQDLIGYIHGAVAIITCLLLLFVLNPINNSDKPAHAPYEARKTNKRAEMLLIRVNVLRGSTLEEACQKAHDKMKEYGFEPCIPYQMLYIKHDDMPYRQYNRYSAEEEKLLGDKERGEVRENSSQNLDSKYVAITKEWVEREEKAMYPQAYHNFVEKYRQQRNNVPYFDYKKEITEDEWKLYNIVYNTFRENQGWWEYNTLEAYENEDYIVYSEIPKNEGEYNSMMSRSTRAGSYIKPKTLVWDEKYGMCEILGYHGIFYAVKTDDGRIVEDGIVTGNEKQMKRIK